MSWIEQVERIDNMLHDQGVPVSIRQKAVAEIANILIQAEKERKRLARRKEILDAVKNCKYRVKDAAEKLHISRQAVYNAIHDENCQVENLTT